MSLHKTFGALLRLSMGWIFFWSFIDKLWGLGFSTTAENAWLAGGSPTYGFLSFATKGPFAEFFQGLAGNMLVDWIFMIGLAAVGIAMLLGIGVRIAGYSGALILVLMYLAGFIWPEHNPFLDDHLVYAILMIWLTTVPSGHWFGFGKYWERMSLVRKFPFLV